MIKLILGSELLYKTFSLKRRVSSDSKEGATVVKYSAHSVAEALPPLSMMSIDM